MILDITAGNRHIWKGVMPEVPLDELVVFCDKEIRLKVPPDIFCDNRRLPCREGVADIVIYDPPHWDRGKPFVFGDPTEETGCWWGQFKNKSDAVRSIAGGVKESKRVLKESGLLHFKWSDGTKAGRNWKKLDHILTLFIWAFKEISRSSYPSKSRHNANTTYWITFRKLEAPP
jgi:hypothetical protein